MPASSGPGGQHVNKTASAIRMTHKETGLVVRCFEERSQHKNLAKAIRLMKSRLYDHFQQKEAKNERTREKVWLVQATGVNAFELTTFQKTG